jgi:chorismate mutase/prephenate dehydratase
MATLDALRHALDEIDDQFVDLVARRQDTIRKIAAFKAGSAAPLRDDLREARQIARLTERARDARVDELFVVHLFRQILEFSVRTQEGRLGGASILGGPSGLSGETDARPIVVAYQGSEGAFSHIAARRFFATRHAPTTYRGMTTFRGMLEGVRSGAADYALLPIENTTSGSVHDAYDALSHSDLAIVGEEVLRIELCLIGLAETPLEKLTRVYSHPQALSQCTAFLAALPHCTVESFTDTAMSVERIKAEGDPSHAAIASAEAATLNGLHILRRDIANHRENYTRFLVVAREPERWDPRVPCKTSIMIVTRHERGALLACLNVLAAHNINLTKLESRPKPGSPFEYQFYIDVEGNVADANLQRALDEMTGLTRSIKIFGSYPARTQTSDDRRD